MSLALWSGRRRRGIMGGPKVHAAEVVRFRSKIVTGPRDECSIRTAASGRWATGGTRSPVRASDSGVHPNAMDWRRSRDKFLAAACSHCTSAIFPCTWRWIGRNACADTWWQAPSSEIMRRMARARCGGGRPTIRGLEADARRALDGAAWRRAGQRLGCWCGLQRVGQWTETVLSGGRASGNDGALRVLPRTEKFHDSGAFGEDEQLALVCLLTRWCSHWQPKPGVRDQRAGSAASRWTHGRQPKPGIK